MISTAMTTALAPSAAVVVVAGLIIFLAARVLVDASERPGLKLFGRDLSVYALPLLVAFVFIVVMEVLLAID
jgi:hypothetical protein